MTQFLMPIRGQKKETTTTVEATGNALSSHVLEGKTFSSSSGTGLTGTMKKNTATTNKLTVSTPDFVIPSGYHDGNGIVKIVPQSKNASPDIVEQVIKADSGNVLSAVTIAPVEGTAGANNVMEGYTFASAGGIDMEGTMKNYGGVNIQPRMSTDTITNILDDKGNAEFGYYGSLTIPSPVTGYVNSSTKFNIGCYGLHPEVVKAGQLIGGDNAVDKEGNKVYGTYTSDATATADSILKGETAYVNGKKIEGAIEKIKGGEIATIAGGSNGYVYINIPKTGFYYANDELNIASTDLTITPSLEKQNYTISALDKLISSVTVEAVPLVANNYTGVDYYTTTEDLKNKGSKLIRAIPNRCGYVNDYDTMIWILADEIFGSAASSDVLKGKTYSSKDGFYLTGTMTSYANASIEPTSISSGSTHVDETTEELEGVYMVRPKTGYYSNSWIPLSFSSLRQISTYPICYQKCIQATGTVETSVINIDLYRGKCGNWKKLYFYLNDHYFSGNDGWTVGIEISGNIIDGTIYHEIVGEMTETGCGVEIPINFTDKRIYLDDDSENEIVINLNIENISNGYIDFKYIFASNI